MCCCCSVFILWNILFGARFVVKWKKPLFQSKNSFRYVSFWCRKSWPATQRAVSVRIKVCNGCWLLTFFFIFFPVHSFGGPSPSTTWWPSQNNSLMEQYRSTTIVFVFSQWPTSQSSLPLFLEPPVHAKLLPKPFLTVSTAIAARPVQMIKMHPCVVYKLVLRSLTRILNAWRNLMGKRNLKDLEYRKNIGRILRRSKANSLDDTMTRVTE